VWKITFEENLSLCATLESLVRTRIPGDTKKRSNLTWAAWCFGNF